MNSDSAVARRLANVEVDERDVADEVADVGDDPALARLDEVVVPKPADVVANRVGAAIDEVEQGLQLAAGLVVGDAVHRRQELVQPVPARRRRGHRVIPPVERSDTSRAGTSTQASSAGRIVDGVPPGRAGSM